MPLGNPEGYTQPQQSSGDGEQQIAMADIAKIMRLFGKPKPVVRPRVEPVFDTPRVGVTSQLDDPAAQAGFRADPGKFTGGTGRATDNNIIDTQRFDVIIESVDSYGQPKFIRETIYGLDEADAIKRAQGKPLKHTELDPFTKQGIETEELFDEKRILQIKSQLD